MMKKFFSWDGLIYGARTFFGLLMTAACLGPAWASFRDGDWGRGIFLAGAVIFIVWWMIWPAISWISEQIKNA